MQNFNIFKTISLWLSIIGALNWGFIGIANFNLIAYFLGIDSLTTRLVYILIGLAGLFFSIRRFYWESKVTHTEV